MNAAEFIKRYHQLFAGNPNVYAIRTEWESVNTETGVVTAHSAYIPSKYNGNKETTKRRVQEVADQIGTAEYDEKAVEAHVRGKQFLGIYPLHPDSTVRLFALDFDGKNGDPLVEAAEQMKVLVQEAELPIYLERSQSGNGFHLWGFIDGPVHAKTVRRAIKQFIEKTATFDRMFPNQNGVTELRPLGNLIALPLFAPRVRDGNSVFGHVIESAEGLEFSPFDDQRAFLGRLRTIPASRIEELAAAAPEIADEKPVKAREGAADGALPGVKKVVDPRFGCEWVRWHIEYPEEVTEPEWYALACNLAQLRGGREMFHEISALSKRYDPASCDMKFDQAIEVNAPHTCDYIRSNLKGPQCLCDQRYPGKVFHPYGLGKITLYDLMKGVAGEDSTQDAVDGFDETIGWLEEVEKNPVLGWGITTGITSVDEHVGFRDATLNILAARPSIGKTALALDFAYRMASAGIPVYFFSLEMSRKQLWLRLLARVAGVSGDRMRKGALTREDWQKIREAREYVASLAHFPLFVDDTTRDIRWIMENAWNLQEEHGKGIVMIDYLGLLEWRDGENEYAATTRNSKECKLMAKALDCPNLVLHQFNRTGDDMGVDAATFDSWLRSSGQIEQDADVILYLLGNRGPGIVERCLVKQKDRDGTAGIRIPLEFNQAIMQFGGMGSFLKGVEGASAIFEDELSLGENEGELAWGTDE